MKMMSFNLCLIKLATLSLIILGIFLILRILTMEGPTYILSSNIQAKNTPIQFLTKGAMGYTFADEKECLSRT
jgi:hypothetical protein